MKQSRYYLPNSSKPYSGKIVFRYENGDVSNIVEIKKGVPDGKWIAYGYKKEIVQEGSYTPIDLRNEVDFVKDSINRLNVCITKEGMVEFTDILLITDRPNQKDANDEKKRVLAVLKSHSILVKGDTINEIKYVKNELSNQLKFYTTNPHCFAYQTDELVIELLGGVRIEGLNRMRVTMKLIRRCLSGVLEFMMIGTL